MVEQLANCDQTEESTKPRTLPESAFKTALDLIVLLTLSAIATTILVRDVQIRICDVLVDECLVAHCKFFANPNFFDKDIEFQSWSRIALSSLLNWLPAIICKASGAKPEFFYALFVHIQNSLIVCATYLLGRATTRGPESRPVSLLAAMFMMVWRPQWWNCALMCGLDWMPYSNWFALPFLLLGFYAAILGKKVWTILLICIGTLIHPILGMLASLVSSLYFIVSAERAQRLRTALQFLLVSAVTASLIFIPIRFAMAGLEFAKDADRLSVLMKNIHASPWLVHYPYGISSFTAALIYCFTFTLMALMPCAGKERNNQGQKLFLCTAGLAAMATLTHCLAAFIKLAPVQNLIVSRSTILLLASCAPLMMWQFWNIFTSGRIFASLTILVFLFCACPITAVAATLTVLSQRSVEKKEKIKANILCGTAAALTAVVLLYQAPFASKWIETTILTPVFGQMLPQMVSQSRNFLFDWRLLTLSWLALIFLKFANSKKLSEKQTNEDNEPQAELSSGKTNRLKEFVCFVLVAALSFATFTENRKKAKPDIENTRNYYKAQVWARDNTPTGSSFILVNTTNASSWRGLTGRQLISAQPIGEIYCSTKPVVEHNKKLAAFLAQHPGKLLADKGNLQDYETEDWLKFAAQFGGDFIVRRKDWPALQLPLVYQNEEFVIYKLQAH